jgi:hypothetical protein
MKSIRFQWLLPLENHYTGAGPEQRRRSGMPRKPAQRRQRASPTPAESHVVTWLSACRRRKKRPSSSTRQANKVGRMSRRASRISHLILVRSVTGEMRRRSEHKIALHKAASEVRRYIVIFNNGSPTEPNGVSELGLAPHRATALTTKHSPLSG